MQKIPASTKTHHTTVQQIEAQMASHLDAMWRRVDTDRIGESWSQLITDGRPRIEALQYQAAVEGASYTGQTLAEQDGYEFPAGFVNPEAFVGYAPDGRELDGLLESPVVHARTALGRGASVDEAMRAGSMGLQLIGLTMVADISRQAASVDVAARPHVGFTRMLNPPSCSRCVILAGKYFEWNTGFERHPHCDCVHIPANEKQLTGAQMEGLIQDPYEYFRSLDQSMQDRVFGKADAQAIRDGSDIFQVVNSRRGRSKNKVFTLEGTTRRGNAAKGLKKGQRRLTPDGIYDQARRFNLSREETLKLLETHGYVLPGGQNPLGSLRGQHLGYGQYGGGGRRKAASNAVREARASGVRDPQNPYTMTAAERRVYEAERNWLEVQSGYNPYTAAAVERRRGVRIWSSDAPLDDAAKARAEREYREALLSRGSAVKPVLTRAEQRARLEEFKAAKKAAMAGNRTIVREGRLASVPNTNSRRGQTGGAYYKKKPTTPATAAGGAGGKIPPRVPISAGANDHEGDRGRKKRPKKVPPPIVNGEIPTDWTKHRRVVLPYGGTAELPGHFTNPDGESLWPHELPSVTRLLAGGKNVQWRKETRGGDNSDLLMDGHIWDLKSPKGTSLKTNISDQFKSAGAQGNRMVLDLARIQYSEREALTEIRRKLAGQDRIIEVMVIRKDGTLELLTKER